MASINNSSTSARGDQATTAALNALLQVALTDPDATSSMNLPASSAPEHQARASQIATAALEALVTVARGNPDVLRKLFKLARNDPQPQPPAQIPSASPQIPPAAALPSLPTPSRDRIRKGHEKTPPGRDGAALTYETKIRVIRRSPMALRCLITWVKGSKQKDLNYIHVLARSTSGQWLMHFEWAWGLKYRSLNINSSSNIAIMVSNLHKSYDTTSPLPVFFLIPTIDLLKKVLGFFEDSNEKPKPGETKSPMAEFKSNKWSFWLLNVNSSKGRRYLRQDIDWNNAPEDPKWHRWRDGSNEEPTIINLSNNKIEWVESHVHPFFVIASVVLKLLCMRLSPDLNKQKKLKQLRKVHEEIRIIHRIGQYWLRKPPPHFTKGEASAPKPAKAPDNPSRRSERIFSKKSGKKKPKVRQDQDYPVEVADPEEFANFQQDRDALEEPEETAGAVDPQENLDDGAIFPEGIQREDDDGSSMDVFMSNSGDSVNRAFELTNPSLTSDDDDDRGGGPSSPIRRGSRSPRQLAESSPNPGAPSHPRAFKKRRRQRRKDLQTQTDGDSHGEPSLPVAAVQDTAAPLPYTLGDVSPALQYIALPPFNDDPSHGSTLDEETRSEEQSDASESAFFGPVDKPPTPPPRSPNLGTMFRHTEPDSSSQSSSSGPGSPSARRPLALHAPAQRPARYPDEPSPPTRLSESSGLSNAPPPLPRADSTCSARLKQGQHTSRTNVPSNAPSGASRSQSSTSSRFPAEPGPARETRDLPKCTRGRGRGRGNAMPLHLDQGGSVAGPSRTRHIPAPSESIAGSSKRAASGSPPEVRVKDGNKKGKFRDNDNAPGPSHQGS